MKNNIFTILMTVAALTILTHNTISEAVTQDQIDNCKKLAKKQSEQDTSANDQSKSFTTIMKQLKESGERAGVEISTSPEEIIHIKSKEQIMEGVRQDYDNCINNYKEKDQNINEIDKW